MYSPAAQGFGRVAANLGLNTLGSATGRNYERELGLGSTGLKGFASIEAAKARSRAIEYAGQQAGRAAMFGGLMDGLGSLASAGIGKMAANKAYLKDRYGSSSMTPFPSDQLPDVFPGPVTPPTAPPPVPQSFYGGFGGF